MPGAGRTTLDDALATPDAKHRYVRRLFATIADRYDLITVLLSFGRDRHWKRRLANLADARAGAAALDLACGTGDIAFELSSRGVRVIGLDVTFRMLQLARGKQPSRQGAVTFVGGDMMALPFADGSFDLVTAGYGIRNVPAIAPALAEARRVLRAGGLFLSLDFNRPESRVVRSVYLAYLTAVGSSLGVALHGDPDTYRYIPATIRRYPGATRVAEMAVQQGFAACEWFPVLGGLMAIHRARR